MDSVYYLHQLDPFLIRFTETIGIRWYSLAYITTFIFGYFFINYLVQKKRTFFQNVQQVSDFLTFIFLGVLVGGRLGYVIFYQPATFLEFSSSFPFWEVLSIHKGGMSSHGGFIGVMVACFLQARVSSQKGISFLGLLDLVVIPASLGFGLGRLTNFINGELYGRVVVTPVTWAVQFPSEMYQWLQTVNKVKLSSLSEAVQALNPSINDWKERVAEFPIQNRNFIFSHIEQLIQATQTKHTKVIEALSQVLSARHPSQIYQAFLEGFFLMAILIVIWKKPRTHGIIAGSSVMIYSVMRIIGENYRMPDLHIGYELLGFTRGQWLSLGLFMVGVLIFVSAFKKGKLTHGGIFHDS